MSKAKKKKKKIEPKLTNDIATISKSLTKKQREELIFYIEHPEFEQMPARDFSQFIDDPYYLSIGEDTWDKVKEEGDKIWGKYWSGEINEAILLWGIGSGKSLLSSILSLQYVQQLLCMENPHKFFKITNDKPIAVVNMGPTATQAKNVVFAGMKKLVEASPFFAQFNPDILTTEIRFSGKNIALYCGNSRETMPIGMNVILGVMDEAAWYIDTDQKSIAEDIYNTLSNRIASRFGDRGLMIIISAPRYIDDFITIHYNQAQDLDKVYASSYKTWEVKNKEVMSEETFDFIVSTDKNGKPTEVWEGIPIDFKASADRNPERFMRDFGARPSLVLEPFDKDAQIIVREARDRGVPIDEQGRLKDWFKTESDEARYMHIDLGLTKDACGIAMGHKMKDIEIDGEKLPYIYIDLVHRIKPKQGEQIQFSEVRQLIYTLKDRGFNIQKVTLDQYQCLSKGTRIPLLKGIDIPIEKVKAGDYVYSLNNKGEVVAGLVISGAKMTGKKRLWKITLDNKRVIRCSGNHPFMLRDGSYKRVDELKVSDRLMPFYKKKGMKDLKDYERVYNPKYNKYEYTHRLIARQMNILRKGKVIHHKNFDKKDNAPGNLTSLLPSKHHKLHKDIALKYIGIAREALKNNPEALRRKNEAFLKNTKRYRETATFEQRSLAGKKSWKTKLKKGFKPYIRTEETKNKNREATKKQWQSKDWTERKKKMSEALNKRWENPEYRKHMSEIHKGKPSAMKGGYHTEETKEKISQTKKEQAEKRRMNHKVIGIEKTNKIIEMYDIEVKDFHNFALKNGVFVHNSVDTLQILNDKGITAEIQSVDRDTQAYETLKEALHQKRFDCYPYGQLHKEYQRLELVKGKKVDHPPGGSKDVCLSGDTKVSLLDGREVPIKELVGESGFEVYSALPNGQIKIGRVKNVICTGLRKDVFRIWLDNNKFVDCTSNHPFMLRNGGYKRADEIKVNDSLMPLYRRLSVANSKAALNGYSMVKQNNSGEWDFTHQLVARDIFNFAYGNMKETRQVIHHKDFDKRNNDSNNLEIMSWDSHRTLHNRVGKTNFKALWLKPEFREICRKNSSRIGKMTGSKNITKYNKSKSRIEKLKKIGLFSRNGSMVMKKLWQDKGFRESHRKRVTGNGNPFARKDVTLDKIIAIAEKSSSQKEILEGLQCSQKVLHRILKENGIAKHKFGQKYYKGKNYNQKYLNHKVVKVERIKPIEVFDMKVEKYHNFALTAGVFVHNSDAIAGVCKLIVEEHEMEPFIFVL